MAGQARTFIVLAIALVAIVPFGQAFAPAPAPVLLKRLMPLAPDGMGMADAPGEPAAANDLIYHGGPIQKAPRVYLVFWGWNLPNSDPDGMASYLTRFFGGVGGSAFANVHTQYDDPTHGSITNPANQLAGVWYDNGPLPPEVPDAYFATEALRAAQHFGFVNGSYDGANYFIVTPYLRGSLLFETGAGGYCAWHSYTSDGLGHDIAFTNMPYVSSKGSSCGANRVNAGAAGKLDGVSIVAGHESTEAVTDPLIDAWYAPNGENADLCAWRSSGAGAIRSVVLSTGTFAVQGAWSNLDHDCRVQ